METNNKNPDSKNPKVAKLSKSILTKILWIMAKIIGVVAGILVTLFLIVGLYSEYAMEYEPYHGKKFDREIWMSVAEPGCSKLVRCKMTADIVDNHLQKGMKKEEVEDLLGKIRYYFYCIKRDIKCGSYNVGSCSTSALGSLGSQSIDVCFNREEKLVLYGRNAIPCTTDNKEDSALCDITSNNCTCYSTDEQNHTLSKSCKILRW